MKHRFTILVILLVSIFSYKNTFARCTPDIDSEREIVFQETIIGETSTENLIIKNVSTCQNSEDGNLLISQINIENSAFEINEDNCSNTELAQGKSCLISIKFEPLKEILYKGTLYIPSNGEHEELPNNPGDYSTSPLEVSIQGNAIYDDSEPTITDPGYSINNAPTQFNLISPLNGSIVESESVDFKWQKNN